MDYIEVTGQLCTAEFFNGLASNLQTALANRGVSWIGLTVNRGEYMLPQQISIPLSACDTIRYATARPQATKGDMILAKYVHDIQQAISDLNNLVRCSSGCTGNCTTGCSNTCSNTCGSGCTGSCRGNKIGCGGLTWWCGCDCNNSCSGSCSRSCSYTCGNNCNGGCASSCNNYCQNTCKASSYSMADRAVGSELDLS